LQLAIGLLLFGRTKSVVQSLCEQRFRFLSSLDSLTHRVEQLSQTLPLLCGTFF